MATFTRTETDIIGTVASPSSISGSASTNGSIDVAGANGARSEIAVHIIIAGSAPTTSPTVQFQYSMDGTNYYNDGGAIQCPAISSTNYDYYYPIPPTAKKGKVIITNGASNTITAYAQANVLTIT
jgi:hypothetical protein